MAIAAHYFSKPFVVACHKIKLAGQQEVYLEDGPGFFKDLPHGVVANAPLFDVTPSALISAIVTEAGVFSSQEAGEIGKHIAQLRRTLLNS